MFENILTRVYRAFHLFLQQPYKVIGSITLFGALLRFYHLGYKSLWLDEAVLYWSSQGNFKDVIAQTVVKFNAPPLFALLTNLVSRISDSEANLRAIPCLAGIAAIPAMYFLSRQFLSRNPAYFCTFLVAIARSQIKYSQELREYSVTFFLAILMLAFFNQYLCESNWKNWGLLTTTWVLSIFFQYGLALLILALNLIFAIEMILSTNRKVQLSKWIISQLFVLGTVLIVYQSWLKYQMVPGGVAGSGFLAQAYWDGSFASLIKLAIKNTYEIFDFTYPRTLFLFISCVGFLVILKKLKDRNDRIAFMMFVFPMACTFVAACAKLYPYHSGRHDIFLTPMIYILAGFGLTYLSSLDKKQIVILPLLLILGLTGLRWTYGYLMYQGSEHMRPLAMALSSSFKPGDRIYIYYYAVPAFRYYYQSNKDQWIYGVRIRGKSTRYYYRSDLDQGVYGEYLQQINEMLFQPGRVWMIFSHCVRGECQLIQNHASELRNVELVAQDRGAWLYLAH